MSVQVAAQRAEAYMAAVDAAAPGRLAGLYLVGSAALGDWQEKVSNVDVVAVAERPWDASLLASLSEAHRLLDGRGEPGRVAYLTYTDLAAGPAAAGPPCFEGGRAIESDEFATPLTWAVLAEEAVSLRGPEYFAVADDREALRAWASARLAGRWKRWADTRRPGRAWMRQALAEDVLEVSRLYVAATRGLAVAKLRAGALALEDLGGRHERVIADAAGFRRGSRMSMYWGPIERKHHGVDLVEELVERASAQATGDVGR